MDALAFLGEDGEFLIIVVAACVALSLVFIGSALLSTRSGNAHDRRLEAVKQRGSGKRVSTGPIAIKRGESTGAMGELERAVAAGCRARPRSRRGWRAPARS